ncbi:hypothetical protein BH11ACT4_BH11ACT4_16110 [soil metagenome]
MDDNNFGVPAGWYPDPLGLPQLRWWDAQAWTEHTSEARAPIVIQPASRVAYADEDLAFDSDEELPSRRDLRDRERRENGDLLEHETLLDTEQDDDQEELSAQPLLAMTLRELEPPLGDERDGATPGPRRASSHTNAVPAASTLSAMAEELPPERAPKRMRTYTFAVWAIALMPAVQLAVAILMLLVFDLSSNYPLIVSLSLLANLAILGLAFYDRLQLQAWGHKKPASGWWAILREPPYLIARALRTFTETGKGFAPLAVWTTTLGAILAAVLILPGLVISLVPSVFQAEAQQSIQADAAALGADITVQCPSPPLLIGESFTCTRTSPNGATDLVAVSLQRENGWISWRVEDWGAKALAGALGK